ncbi:CHRD domain-containing protein [Pantanalinema rosaneae CENA516]|uniref:CHRD domain-containing protein n=1 Tax=Pantanalinema rosaneae TaxID=1620701 RepID=UPI003D6E28A9
MKKATRSLVNIVLSALTCVLLIGVSTAPTFSQRMTTATMSPTANSVMGTPSDLAQGMSNGTMKRYAAPLINASVVPNAPSTSAMGVAEASLMGNRLMVRGAFMGLSSRLRDYATDPVDPPNPKITSAAHIHRGDNTQNGPFQYALTVMLDQTGMGGKFSGNYTLTPEQLQALADGKLYVDIHTQQHRAGELRGIFRPL